MINNFTYVLFGFLIVITLNGCNSTPSKGALTCGVSHPCGGCKSGCPYDSSYKKFFKTCAKD